MHDGISGQAVAIARVLKEEEDAVSAIAKEIQQKLITDVHLVGIGTSWHASLVAEHFFKQLSGISNVWATHSFEFSLDPPQLGAHSAVIIISHRGTKRYSLSALKYAHQQGALTILITGIGSPVDSAADFAVRTSEQEKSSAFTISYTCALAALLSLSVKLGVAKGIKSAQDVEKIIGILPELVATTQRDTEDSIKEWVGRVKHLNTHYFIGYGANTSTAYEVALKIKETSYEHAEGFQLEQYLHGPFCATDAKTHVCFLLPSSIYNTGDDLAVLRSLDIMKAASSVGASVSAIAGKSIIDKIQAIVPDELLVKVENTHSAFAPFTFVVSLQLFTYWLAIEKGRQPDVFRRNDPLYKAAKGFYEL